MSTLHSPRLKAITLSLFAALVLIAAPVATRADQVTFEATSAGCFGIGCTGFALTSSVPGLTFAGSTQIGPATSDASGSLHLDNLGTFTLSDVPGAGDFTLQINFTQPDGLRAGQSVTITASITRVVNTTDTFDITFNNPTDVILFDRPFADSSFQLTINALSIALGQSATLQGDITNATLGGPQVPEPATLGLLATGLSGLVGLARRRRKRARSAP